MTLPYSNLTRIALYVGAGIAAILLLLACGSKTFAATLKAEPEKPSINVGDTFTVKITLNTQGESVNAVDVHMSFPPDKLQVTSPSSGNSIIGIYTTPPKYNNQTGTLEIAGGVPSGINVNSGLIATITFRAKAPGSALIKFLDDSKVLLNDGKGTDALRDTTGGIVALELPPPEGPTVRSSTHPSSDTWYRTKTASLLWDSETPGALYSYTLSDQPGDDPDDIAEGTDTHVEYRTLPDGVHYFHIKAARDGKWGGTTHFAFRIDSAAPAEFPIEIIPRTKTAVRQPVFNFGTTDALSGIARYEIKIVPLKSNKPAGEESLFIEATSPYNPSPLELGNYEVIVRAYDNADNIRESSQRLEISNFNLWFLGRSGIEIRNVVTVSWGAIAISLIALLILLIWLARKIHRWHHHYETSLAGQKLPDQVQQQLEELKRYQNRYGKITAAFLCAFTAGALSMQFYTSISAADNPFTPPTITSYSEEITEEELFYISGRTEKPNTEVILHLQHNNLSETYNFTVTSDNRGDWLYRSENPLSYGSYSLWTQMKQGEQFSPPSAQVLLTVHKVAFSLAGTKITYLATYVSTIIILSIVILLLIAYVIVKGAQGRKKRKHFLEQLKLAEESIRRGFILLKRDIQGELALIKQAQLSPALSAEEKVREEQLLADLKYIEDYVGKELWETEHFTNSDSK